MGGNYKGNLRKLYKHDLGPILFLISINDLPLCNPNQNADLFADESTISVIEKNQRYISQDVVLKTFIAQSPFYYSLFQ